VCVTLCVCVCVCVRGACVCVCEWRGEFNRVVLVVQLALIFHFILNPEQRRVFQLVAYTAKCSVWGLLNVNMVRTKQQVQASLLSLFKLIKS
jgi:hypothetical protein